MNFFRSVFGGFSNFYYEINGATLTGAIDVIVVEQPDGTYVSSPFHVRFGKLGVLRSREKVVDIEINDVTSPIHMKLGETGEAFFVQEVEEEDDEDLPIDLATSPIPDGLYSPPGELNIPSPASPAEAIDESCPSGLPPNFHPYSDGEVSPPTGGGSPIPESKFPPRPASPLSDSEIEVAASTKESHGHDLTSGSSNSEPANSERPSWLWGKMPHVPSSSRKTSTMTTPLTPAALCQNDSSTDLESLNSVKPEKHESESVTKDEIVAEATEESVGKESVIDVQIEVAEEVKTEEEGDVSLPPMKEDTDIELGQDASTDVIIQCPEVKNAANDKSIAGNNNTDDVNSETRDSNYLSGSDEDFQGNVKSPSISPPNSISPPMTIQNNSHNSSHNNSGDLLHGHHKRFTKTRKRVRRCKKTLRLTHEQILGLGLYEGFNEATFSVTTAYQGTTRCKCSIYLWKHDDKIVISDIDGTITKSDVLGQILPIIGRDWAQSGVTNLYTKIQDNGYKFVYLSARAIGQAGTTRDYLRSVVQADVSLPDGPLLLSPTSLISAFHREVIEKKPEEFKISCLKDIQALFPSNPFYAGFGNKINDTWAYRAVNIPLSRIFTVNHRGELKLELIQTFQSSYTRLSDVVDQMFPPLEYTARKSDLLSEYSTFNYWKDPIEEINEEEDDLIKSLKQTKLTKRGYFSPSKSKVPSPRA